MMMMIIVVQKNSAIFPRVWEYAGNDFVLRQISAMCQSDVGCVSSVIVVNLVLWKFYCWVSWTHTWYQTHTKYQVIGMSIHGVWYQVWLDWGWHWFQVSPDARCIVSYDFSLEGAITKHGSFLSTKCTYFHLLFFIQNIMKFEWTSTYKTSHCWLSA